MTDSELRADIHSIEPIPDADRDSTGPQQMWIWAGANIAPVNWALGALGIILKLGLMETIAVIVLGNIVGCAIFATFTVMGHKTGVNQMVLSRSAFGVRGAYLPSILMFVMTLGWIGVNTYFPVKVSIGILGQFGVPDTWLIEIVIITLVMAAQVLIGVYGFYAIRTFEKYTVPPTIAIMVLMSVLAWTRPGVVNWSLTTSLPPGAHLAMLTLLMTAIGVGWGISWVTWASDYSRFVPKSVPSKSVFWYSYVGMFVPTVWLGILGATIASTTLDTDPAKMVSAVFGGPVSILVLLMVLHGPIATNILNVYSATLAALSAGLKFSRFWLTVIVGVAGYLVTLYFIFAPSFAKAFDNWMMQPLVVDEPVGRRGARGFLPQAEGQDRRRRALPLAGDQRLWRHQLGRHDRVLRRPCRRMAGGRRPGRRASGAGLDQPPGRSRSELAVRDRRLGAGLSGAGQARHVALLDRCEQRRPVKAWTTFCDPLLETSSGDSGTDG
ncbi:cytosine permease [Bradyrhizobium diazoefficiens]